MAKYLPTRGGKWWVFRDRFGAALAAGNVDSSAATPGTGLREVTDAENKIFTTGGRLRGGGQDSPVWGDSKVVWTRADGSGWSRVAGRTLAALLLFEDTIVDADVAFGWATALDIVDPRTDGHGFLQEGGGRLKIIVPGSTIQVETAQRNLRPMQYLVGVTLNDRGAVVWYSTFGVATGIQMTTFDTPQFPTARIIWLEYDDQTAALFPYVSYYGKIDAPAAGYPDGNSLEDLRVVDPRAWSQNDPMAGFADRFARDDSAVSLGNDWTAVNGTWGIASGKAYLATGSPPTGFFTAHHGTGLADGDGIYQWYLTTPDVANAHFSLLYRYQDASNYYRLLNNGADQIILQKWVGGALTTLGSNAQVWAAATTYRIVLYVESGRHILKIDDVEKVDASGHDELNTVTTIGMQIYDDGSGRSGPAGHKFDNLAAYPQTFTLPTVLQRGKVPDVLTGGEVLAQDTFTGVDGTTLPDHSPESGAAWETDNSEWQIQGNKADPVLHATLFTSCVQDLGTMDAECQVDIYIPAGIDDFFYGIVGRYVNSDSYLGARLCWANYAPSAHEVEIIHKDGGVTNVRHKVNLAAYFTNDATYTLKVQFKDDLMQVFLDGTPVLSYYTIEADPLGTKFGLNADHAGRTDEGGTFDNWIAKEL